MMSQEDKDRLDQLKKEIQLVKDNYRLQKKNLDADYKRQMDLVKGDLSNIEKSLSVKKGSLKERLVYQMDSLTLYICKPFEEKAAEIRYKRHDPDGYEADQIYLASGTILKHCQHKVEKGKKLSSKEVGLLNKLSMAFTTIQEKQLGEYHDRATSILSDLNKLIPTENNLPEVPEEIKQSVSIINNLMNMLQPQVVPTGV